MLQTDTLSQKEQFSINASSCTLKRNNQENGKTILGPGKKYRIPIYQREYSWTETELKKFISDLFISFSSETQDGELDAMFIGTMQLSKNKKNENEIIDGQQRLTTFLLLLKLLKTKYPESHELKTENFDWLKTDVSNGEQQRYLDSTLENLSDSNNLNPYTRNYIIIKNLVENQIENHEETDAFNIDDFINFIFSKVYFVIIETQAGLSKTLQIFDAINTTGLDLNGGDIFKIRMYEYLHDVKKQEKSVFEDISQLYQKIDKGNQQYGDQVTDIQQILGIYQIYLIAKYNLPNALYALGANTFFERLFDTILYIEEWEHFSKAKNVEISLKELDELIDFRFLWHKKYKSGKDITAEDIGAIRLIWYSRYGRYWYLYFILLFVLKNDEDCWSKLKSFTLQLNRLFFIYSVRFDKRINEIYATLMHQVIDSLVNKSSDEALRFINEKIGDENKHNGEWKNLNSLITQNVLENNKRKNLICRLSALLEENYETENEAEIQSIISRVFHKNVDIEHIESYNHIDESQRHRLHREWGHNINAIGNLMALESNINRKIKNKPYSEKVAYYKESEFPFVKRMVKDYPQWNLNSCEIRTERERKKILEYLFEMQ